MIHVKFSLSLLNIGLKSLLVEALNCESYQVLMVLRR